MKTLVIEDDPEIIEYVRLALLVGWPEAEVVSTPLGERGIEMMAEESPDVILLDLGLPDIDGCEVLKRIRRHSSIPVIITSVRSSLEEVCDGLGSGANAYLIKPFEQAELIDQLKAVTLRNRPDMTQQ